MAGAVTAPAIYYSSPTALGVYQNASRFLAIQFGVGMPTEQEGLVDMSKVMAEPNQVSPAQKIVLNKKTYVFYTPARPISLPWHLYLQISYNQMFSVVFMHS
jgi:hypothetical protein